MGDLTVTNNEGDSRSAANAGPREYTAGSASRHRSAANGRRLFFFVLASLWGFAVGVAGLLVALGAAGRPVDPPVGALALLLPALVLAAGGGCIMAAGYKEAKRRSR
jgi:hypothetical protein